MGTGPVAAREDLIRGLRRYTVGPLDPAECIPERASERYHTGFLSPAGTPIDPEEDDQPANDEADEAGGVGDSILALANLSRQSAMGMTFQVDPPHAALLLRVEWANYQCRAGSGGRCSWQRVAVGPEVLSIPAGAQDGSAPLLTREGVSVRVLARELEGVRVVTVSVVNERPETEGKDQDHNAYQVRLEVQDQDGRSCFVSKPPAGWVLDDEFWGHELLYRDTHQFAVGHGCAVEWNAESEGRTDRIRTEWVPATEVRKASTDVLSGLPALSVELLADLEARETTCPSLKAVPDGYGEWLLKQESSLPGILARSPEKHRDRLREVADANLATANTALHRMREGIALLETDDLAWKAFCFASEAMALSMKRTRPDAAPRWRAFQLAFILQCLPSTADPGHPDRGVMDLIWFPTGGGKTEAYLGLALFAIFHRRLAAPGEPSGTVVLTRYTLRLLTIQQFERAARTICAAELVRRQFAGQLGSERITVGLFLGGAATPNRMQEAEDYLRDGGEGDGGQTTCPLVRCPWCSAGIGPRNQRIEAKRLVTRCPGKGCEFSSGLPLLVVDEEIYEHPPTFVIGTVDKFAVLPWEPAAGALLGYGAGAPHRPPTLILQDELHLISDSLGTIAALYETAIDHLCSRNGALAKVVGSTATIRRAREQTRRLFNRSVAQFPPGVLDVKDSFFYCEDRNSPGRTYVGVHAQGRSPKHTLARVTGTLAQLASQIARPAVRDSYHTLVCYFNSLRELGGAVVLAEDDVPRYIQAMPLADGVSRRTLPYKLELTSVGLPQSEIPKALAQLETRIPELEDDDNRVALDLVLATNMISVGVDVDRLSLMVVNGQPKTTSEYIQASSRVGRPRASAGMVVTLYNWTRPRDRSHYERFLAYHQAFYRHVESSSVTPFAARARDRALPAALFALARIAVPELRLPESPGRIGEASVEQQVEALIDVIVARVAEVDPDEAEATRSHLSSILSLWREAAEEGQICWRQKNMPGGRSVRGVMRRSDSQKVNEGLFPAGHSMRDVEPPSAVRLLPRTAMAAPGGR